MQNPLRRPRGDQTNRRGNPPPFQDTEQGGEDGAMSKGMRGHFVAMTGEFIGTVMFLYFAFGATQIANNVIPPTEASLDRLLFISLAFGFSLAVTAWVFYRVSGGLFNPAVSLVVSSTWEILIIKPGYTGPGACWWSSPRSWRPTFDPSDAWRHGRRWASFVHVSGSTVGAN